MNYPLRKVIAVDVDGTLISRFSINESLIKLLALKKSEGHELILWSARGKEHALRAAKKTGTEHLFDAIISKPGTVVDDLGWGWVKWTRVIHPARLSQF